MSGSRRSVLLALALTLAYVLTGKLGLSMDAVSRFATLVWAPSGIALAAVVLLGYRAWPAVWLGAFVVNWWTGAPFFVACAIGAANTLEAIAGTWLLRRIPGFHAQLDRVEDVVGLVFLAACGSTVLGATMGTLALSIGGQLQSSFAETWRTWWLGDAIGDLIVAPVLLTMPWATGKTPWWRSIPARVAEELVLAASLSASGIYLFFGGAMKHYSGTLQHPFMETPLLIWAALRFGVLGLSRSLVVVTVIAIWGTAAAYHPFRPGALRAYLVDLQVYLAAMGATFLVLSAVAEERRRALDRAVEAQHKLSILADASTVLASTLEFRTAANELAKLVVGRIGRACGCTLDLLAPDGTLHRYAAAASDPEKERLLEEEGRFSPKPPKSPLVRACQGVRPVLVEQVDAHVLDDLAQSPEHRTVLERLGLHSMMIVPMVARDRVLGVLTVPSMRPERHYDETEIAFLEELARRSAVHIDNARLFEAAANAIRVREDTLAMVAHDLRSPLGAIKMGADLLTASADPRRVASTAKTISSASDRMNHLVAELLETTFLEAGALVLHREALDVEPLVDECILLHAQAAATNGLRIHKHVDHDAGVLADRERLLQALDNLLANAIKFTPRGGRIEVRAEREDGSVLFSVADTGPGIPAEALPHLFERFSKSTREGHGLGLFIAQAIVQAHGGRIEVDSEIGAGTTFRFAIATPEAREERAVTPRARRRRQRPHDA